LTFPAGACCIARMKAFFPLFMAALLCAEAHAEVIIYKNHILCKRAGGFLGNATSTLSISGWMILEMNEGSVSNVVQVTANPKTLIFAVDTPTNKHSEVTVNFSLSGSGTVIWDLIQFQSGLTRNMVAKGVDRTLFIGHPSAHPGSNFGYKRAPGSYRVSGIDIYESYCDEYRGSMTFDRALTHSANTNVLDLAQTVDLCRSNLLAKGYVEGATSHTKP
jgi:hypothetical protein